MIDRAKVVLPNNYFSVGYVERGGDVEQPPPEEIKVKQKKGKKKKGK